MAFFKDIRETFGKRSLEREEKRLKREGRFINLSEANSIGILFLVEDEKKYGQVRHYVKALREEGIKTVQALGYIDDKVAPEFAQARLGFDFFTRKDLNWYSKPSGTTVANFVHEPFDILIDLTLEESMPLQWILRTSNAHCKVGPWMDKRSEYYDLMISLKDSSTMRNLMTQVNHYLSEINKKAS